MKSKPKIFQHKFDDGGDRTVCSIEGVEGYCAFDMPWEHENGSWKIIRGKAGDKKKELIPPARGRPYLFLKVPYDLQSKKLTSIVQAIKENVGEIDPIERAIWLRKFDSLAEEFFERKKKIVDWSDVSCQSIEGQEHRVVEEGLVGTLKLVKAEKISQSTKGVRKPRGQRKTATKWLKQEYQAIRQRRPGWKREEWLRALSENFQEKFRYALSDTTIARYLSS